MQVRDTSITLKQVRTDLERRDAFDSQRPTSPLLVAEGATVVESDGLSVEAVATEIERIVRRTWSAHYSPAASR
jgi:cytidylate kinase